MPGLGGVFLCEGTRNERGDENHHLLEKLRDIREGPTNFASPGMPAQGVLTVAFRLAVIPDHLMTDRDLDVRLGPPE